MDDISTYSAELSSTIAATLSAFEEQYGYLTPPLSGIPYHPWELKKWELFGPDYVFPTIDSVVVPLSVSTEMLEAEIQLKNQAHSNLVLSAVSLKLAPSLEALEIWANPFVTLSADGTPHIPESTVKQYVSFLEMINQIDINSLAMVADNPVVIKNLTNKILYSFLSIGK